MEIYNKQNRGYIEVWLTNEEQQMYDRTELAERLLSGAGRTLIPHSGHSHRGRGFEHVLQDLG